MSSNGEGEADSNFYDGQSISGTKLIYMYCLDEAMDQLSWFPPLYFSHGLYLNIGTNVKQLGIQYLPEPKL